MSVQRIPVGSYVRIAKPQLQVVIDQLRARGYRTVGPAIAEGAIVWQDMEQVSQLPIGYVDEQDGGHYRLHRTGADAWFDYVVGPQSLKQFLFPAQERLLECEQVAGVWHWRVPVRSDPPLAVLGVRSCDLHAMQVQDRVFLEGGYVDPAYASRRRSLFLVAVNCRRAAPTCFCHSFKTGPAVQAGYDLALTELATGFIVQVGTDDGGQVLAAADWYPCTMAEVEEAVEQSSELKRRMDRRAGRPGLEPRSGQPRERFVDTADLRGLLLDHLDHPAWEAVSERCLACGNCTMVCPTCFCSSVVDVADLTGQHARRERQWASCFSAEHSYMNSGTVRKTTAARYRQWLTHKLATWHDQFGVSGCTGCGRCITWCPVGIDLTQTVQALRDQAGDHAHG